ncbi:MAG: hypothetical protein P4L39_04170 [Humidesulfovibrio sp.]|nr:hypothetical protein [Humidesulfovibrio sp.]
MTTTIGGVSSPSLNIENSADASPSVSSSATSAFSQEFQNELTGTALKGLNGLLASALAATLKRLDDRLGAVSWPESGTGGSAKSSSGSTSASSGSAATTSSKSSALSTVASTFGGFDPQALTTLAPGTYTLDYLAGKAAEDDGKGGGAMVIHVHSGDTWQDVLSRLARTLGTAGPAMLSRLVPVSRNVIRAPQKHARQEHCGAALGDAAPLRVSGPAAALADAVSDVLASYNEVGGLLARHAQGLGPKAASDWAGLALSRAASLGAVGVQRTGSSLWLSEETFLTALWSDPASTQATLSGADGLLPALRKRVDAALGGGGMLAAASAGVLPAKPSPVMSAGPGLLAAPSAPRTETEVEKAGQLLDRYDAGTENSLGGLDLGGTGGLVRRRG